MGSLMEGPDVQSGVDRQARKDRKAGLKQMDKTASNIKSGLLPSTFSGGGLTSGFDPRTRSVSLTSSPERAGLVSSIASRFGEQAGLVAGLRARVAPGMSDLRSVRLQEIENARRSSVSNLRDNLARRRVLGSSFADDAMQRAEIGFAQEKERVQAETFLQEIDLTNQFIQQEYDLQRSEFSTQLNELNLQADLAANLTAQANDVLKTNASLQADLAMGSANYRANILNTQTQAALAQSQLDAGAQGGAGRLIGTIGGAAIGGYFGGPAGAQAGASIGGSVGGSVG